MMLYLKALYDNRVNGLKEYCKTLWASLFINFINSLKFGIMARAFETYTVFILKCAL